MTASLSEEQLVVLERVKAGLAAWGDAAALDAVEALVSEAAALRARLEKARDALKRWDAPPPHCTGFNDEFKKWDADEQKALDDLHAALEGP